jgi:squalene synthase HpnC
MFEWAPIGPSRAAGGPRAEDTQPPMTATMPEKPPANRQALPGEEAVLPLAAHENFTVASLLAGRAARDHLTAIYGFARLVDELGDEAEGDRLALLDRLERELDAVFEGEPTHPLMRRLQPTVRATGMPRGPFERLIAANRQDQAVARYGTFAELVAYCDLSANPVGELVLHVFGVATPERVALSDRVCTALQLVEHWQDVAEDHARGRIYLPADDMERFGVRPSDLASDESSLAPGAPRTPQPVRELLAFEVERARTLLDEGAPLVGTLRGRARFAVAGYVGGGRANLDAIVAAGYDVLAGVAPDEPHRDGEVLPLGERHDGALAGKELLRRPVAPGRGRHASPRAAAPPHPTSGRVCRLQTCAFPERCALASSAERVRIIARLWCSETVEASISGAP